MKTKTLVALAAAGVLLVACGDDDELEPEVSSRIDAIDAEISELGSELARHTATLVLAVDDLLDLAVEEIAYSEHGRRAVRELDVALATLRVCAPAGGEQILAKLSSDATALLQEMVRHRVVMEDVQSISAGVAEERIHHDRAEPLIGAMLDAADRVRRDATDYHCER